VRIKPNHKIADKDDPTDHGYPNFSPVEETTRGVKLPAYGAFMPGFKSETRAGAWLELRIEHAPKKVFGFLVSKYKVGLSVQVESS
jgi:hypothetical protein